MKIKPKLKLSEELVRIHAHLCGDGCLFKYKTSERDRINRTEIAYFNTNAKLIDSFRKDMKTLFNVKMSFSKKQCRLLLKSIKIGELLLEFGEYGTRKWRIHSIIKKSTKKLKLEWTQAFCHDEGYLPPDRDWIRIKSMNPRGLADLKEMMDSLKIRSTLSGPNCDESYYLNIKKMKGLKDFTKEKSRK